MTMKMVCGSFYMPKENQFRPQGEDAYFICHEEQTIGVADGVGGWSKHGVDAGEYARELMINAFVSVHNAFYNNSKNHRDENNINNIDHIIDPKNVLNEAYAMTKNNNLGLQGSSTACIATLDKATGVLKAANVGDSGFILFRDKKMVYKSPTQQHEFNHPYQLGNGGNCDRPESASEIEVKTVPGDVIVLGTDGLLDNIFPIEIEELLVANSTAKCKDDGTKEGGQGYDCEVLAWTIGELALYNSLDKYYISPFAREAKKAGLEWKGGKVDDITVIVANVVASS